MIGGYGELIAGKTTSTKNRKKSQLTEYIENHSEEVVREQCEATSALDNETQGKIQQAIENLKEKYTILIIAHRLSTIVNCDRILVLDDGKIVDQGTHKELLKKPPLM